MYNKTYRKTSFRVKRPIRGFRDLEVYQRTAKCASEIMTKIIPGLQSAESPVVKKLTDSCLRIPELIASAHSRRFETGDELKLMDDCMEECNKVMVYLEQVRDIFGDKADSAVCDDLVKRYIYVRRKIFNLYKAWKGFKKTSIDPGVEKNTKAADVARKRDNCGIGNYQQLRDATSGLGRQAKDRGNLLFVEVDDSKVAYDYHNGDNIEDGIVHKMLPFRFYRPQIDDNSQYSGKNIESQKIHWFLSFFDNVTDMLRKDTVMAMPIENVSQGFMPVAPGTNAPTTKEANKILAPSKKKSETIYSLSLSNIHQKLTTQSIICQDKERRGICITKLTVRPVSE